MEKTCIGHDAQWIYLKNQIDKGCLTHAYLFTGSRHCGGMTLIRSIVSLVNPAETIYLEPEDLEKKHPLISVRQIQLLAERLSRTASSSGSRIVVIPHAEYLHTESSNALLKILEEPQRDVVFFLRAGVAALLLPTIVSRCSVIRLGEPPIPTDSSPLSQEVAQLALGRIGRAQKYREDQVELADARQRKKDRNAFLEMPLSDRLSHALSFSPQQVEEWLLEIEEDIRIRHHFSKETIIWYQALMKASSEQVLLREQSVKDAFCLRVSSV